MRAILLTVFGFFYSCCYSQNIGIGITNPTATLMVNSSTNPQFHVRQTNTGDYARIRLQTGTSRYWDIAAFNNTIIDNERLNFYNSLAGDVLSLTGTGNVGINNSNPNAPLAFAATLGKKITLYPGATGDVGFAVAGNKLQIYSDNPNADVAIGYDAAGGFIERFAFKPNGALAIIGNTGVAGQVLTSNGSTSFVQWKYPTNILYQNTAQVFQTGAVDVNTSSGILDLTGLTYTFTIPSNGKALISFNVDAFAPYCFACGVSIPVIYVYVDNNSTMTYVGGQITNSFSKTVSGSYLAQLGPGTHTIKLRGATYIPSEPIRFQPGNTSSNMIVQVMLE
jgi:hypothetical protein